MNMIMFESYFTVPSMIITEHQLSLSIFNPILQESTFFSPFPGNYYYVLVRLVVNVDGPYRLIANSSLDTYGILYQTTFDPASPSSNIVVLDDDSGEQNGFGIRQTLTSNVEYFLVVTSYYPQQVGSFQLIVVGSGIVNITEITGTSPFSTIVLIYDCFFKMRLSRIR